MIASLDAAADSSTQPGGVWDYISPSRLSCWLACPLRFRARYVDGIRTPASAAMFVGTQVHGGLEVFYRHRQLGVALAADEVTARIAGAWDEAAANEGMQFESLDKECALRQQAIDLVACYLRQLPADEPRPLAVETQVEAPLVDPATGENLGIRLLGVVDLVLDDPAGPVVCDFKTSSRSSDSLEITHEIQLSAYSQLFRHLTGTRESGLEIRSLIKTKTPKIEFHRYAARSDGHFRRLFSVIREYLDALGHSRFNYRPGFGCMMCDCKEYCEAWSG